MKLWRLCSPNDYKYARAARRGTWVKNNKDEEVRVSPLIIEWLPDSDIIGDFTWVDFNEVVISEKVVNCFDYFCDLKLESIEMVQDEKLYNLKRKPSKPRVLLPYKGLNLYDFVVSKFIEADIKKSSLVEVEAGKSSLQGVEHYTSSWDSSLKDLITVHHPREKNKGLFIDEKLINDISFFKEKNFPTWILCGDNTKNEIQKNNLTNIDFLEVGETF